MFYVITKPVSYFYQSGVRLFYFSIVTYLDVKSCINISPPNAGPGKELL